MYPLVNLSTVHFRVSSEIGLTVKWHSLGANTSHTQSGSEDPVRPVWQFLLLTCYLAVRLEAVVRVNAFEVTLRSQLRITVEGIMESLNMSRVCPLAKKRAQPRQRKVKDASPAKAGKVDVWRVIS